MSITEERKNQIIRAAQRTFKNDQTAQEIFLALTLVELQKTDEMLGPRDLEASYRIRIRNRIDELKQAQQRQEAARLRIWSLVTAFVIGVAVTVFALWLWGIIERGT